MAERKRRRAPWRDNLEAMTMAVIMALLLKLPACIGTDASQRASGGSPVARNASTLERCAT